MLRTAADKFGKIFVFKIFCLPNYIFENDQEYTSHLYGNEFPTHCVFHLYHPKKAAYLIVFFNGTFFQSY